MLKPTITTGEQTFILSFGIFHLALPLLAPPNFLAAFSATYGLLLGLNLADLVIPGCIAVASLSIIFVYTKHFAPMIVLMFLYSCGAFFHVLFITGFFPPLLIVGESSVLAFGIFIDIFTVLLSYDYYRRSHTKRQPNF